VSVDPRIERAAVVTEGAEGLPGAADSTVEVSVTGGQLAIPGASSVGIREVRVVSEEADLDGTVLGRTAVSLFDADESDVAPGDPMRIVDMGRFPAEGEAPSQTTRAEWWWPLALAVLALLALEWLLFHRPTRRAVLRTFGRRPEPLGGPMR
jgi:hypothetical protein